MHSYQIAVVTDWYLGSQDRIKQALSTRLSRAEDIEDLSQEVYLRLLRVPKPEDVKNPQAYLYRIALNVAQEWRQRAAQAWDHNAPVDALEATESPYDEVSAVEQDSAALELIHDLPLAQRTALTLHVIEGMTYEQVASHMAVSRRAVKRYVANGYATLREKFAEGCVTLN
ncbi:MAG: RNA polymerase sigma factor [Pseudomonadota bacterium]